MNLRAARRRPRWVAPGAVALLAGLALGAAEAHWIKPEDIVAGLNANQELKAKAGLLEARRDPKLPRLLLIEVDGAKWRALPPEQQRFLAGQWAEDWRHNVAEGIVGIVDRETQKSLVDFDATGKPK